MHASLPDQPTSLSAVHTTPTTIIVYWSPPTAGTAPSGYEITLFAGVEDTADNVTVSAGGGDIVYSSHEITNLNSTTVYRVGIVSVSGTNRSSAAGPVLAARGDYSSNDIHTSMQVSGVCIYHIYLERAVLQ